MSPAWFPEAPSTRCWRKGPERPPETAPGTVFRVVEAGFNQAEWLDKLSALAASGEFDLIVTSNPALPELCAKVAESYPSIRFFVADAYLAGNPAVHTVLYNQLEQGYIAGYLAGLITTSSLPGANPAKKAGMVIAQTYPTLDKLIRPGFEAGLRAVDPAITLEVRTVGNWYDANRSAELTASLIDGGVDVILPIAGGAGQGVPVGLQGARNLRSMVRGPGLRDRAGNDTRLRGPGPGAPGPGTCYGPALRRQVPLREGGRCGSLGGIHRIRPGRGCLPGSAGGYPEAVRESPGIPACGIALLPHRRTLTRWAGPPSWKPGTSSRPSPPPEPWPWTTSPSPWMPGRSTPSWGRTGRGRPPWLGS
ncbi:MAG: BMP family ABC transporter substrate-binding protein [Desulfobacterales bacterium]|nr:BMP family ABC transporter substrate-binding protein [Desulfobacterales bacterium]